LKKTTTMKETVSTALAVIGAVAVGVELLKQLRALLRRRGDPRDALDTADLLNRVAAASSSQTVPYAAVCALLVPVP
jgi:hypothetical protein